MPFTGFNLKYPEYEVITPQTNLSFSLRSLNVQEEERLKGSLVTPHRITEHLNKCIYEAMSKRPDSVKDYDSFLRICTLKDRDALLYGLYHVTYEEIRNYDVTCASCRKDFPVTIQASSTFNFTLFPHKEILKKRIRVSLPMSEGVTAIIKQPSMLDEIEALNSLSSRPGSSIDMITETLVIDSFEQDIEERKTAKKFTDRVDVYDAYLSLPARDKRIIHEKYTENFGKYGVDLQMKVFCIHCGNEEEISIDIVSQFFRMVYSA